MRALAKEVGVSAPTKLNKADLVKLVYKISNGEMEPPAAPRRGRPKKVTARTKPQKPKTARLKNPMTQNPTS